MVDMRASGTALVLLCTAGASLAQQLQPEDPRLWLDRMSRAVEQLNYMGTFVQITNGRAETMRVIHRVADGQVNERLLFLDGSGREILRNSEETRCILQAEREVLIDKLEARSPLRAALPTYSAALDRYYHFIYHGPDRIADRDTRVIEVRPKDRYRYGYRLWLDQATAMPLQSVMLGETGRTVARMLFTEISFPEHIPDEQLQPEISSEGFTQHVRDATRRTPDGSGLSRWQAERLPEGFALTVISREPGDGKLEEEHLVYTDGLASVSVFVEPMSSGQEPVSGFAALGGSNAFSTIVEGHQVTVIGEVPEPTLRMIGGSMRLQLGGEAR